MSPRFVVMRVVIYLLPGRLVKSYFIEMVSGMPFKAGKITVPVDLRDNIIFQLLVTYLWNNLMYMGKN